ncbi:MAG: hypothetical protein E7266_08555 [Lachnospiraceae bacterium]|nr:hypothetical protein [Lachnospiraceae bacterium]
MNALFPLYIKLLNKYKVSLYPDNKRAFLSVSVAGSLSIEASMVLPLFMFFMLVICSPLFIMNKELVLREKMLETSLKMSEFFYITENVSSMDFAKSHPDIYSAAVKGISVVYAYTNLPSDVSAKLSTVSADKKIIDLIADYKTDIHYPFSVPSLHFIQRCYVRGFCGAQIKKSDYENITVYVTKYGTAYHKDTNCSYLYGANRVETSISYDNLFADITYMNQSYAACNLCIPTTMDNINFVYLTIGAYSYHYSLSCPIFKRTIYAVRLADITGEYSPCILCY